MKTILLHGLGQGPESWAAVRAELGEGPDLLSPALTELFPNGEVRGLEDYCGDLAGPLALCGLSLGGVLALDYALRHPDRVDRLALIGAQFRMPTGLLRVQDLAFRLMPAGMFRSMGLPKADVLRLTRSMAALDFQARLGELRCPVLVACGERDRANRAAALQMKEQIPGAQLLLLEGAGHEANVDQPQVLCRALRTFLE